MHAPQWRGECSFLAADSRHARHGRGEAEIACRHRAKALAVLESLGEGGTTRGSAGHSHALRHRARNESTQCLMPYRLATQMAGQVQRRVPAIGDGEQIAGDLGLDTLVVADNDAAELLTALGLLNLCAHERRPWPDSPGLDPILARIDDGRHGNT